MFCYFVLFLALNLFASENQIRQLKEKAEKLESEGKYFEALKINEQILEIIRKGEIENKQKEIRVPEKVEPKKTEEKKIEKRVKEEKIIITDSKEKKEREKPLFAVGDYVRLLQNTILRDKDNRIIKVLSKNTIIIIIEITEAKIKIQKFDLTGYIAKEDFIIEKVTIKDE